MIRSDKEYEKKLQRWCTFGEMENKQITHSQVESQGRKLRLPRKLPLLLIQTKWTLLPIFCIALIATLIISNTSTNDLLPKIFIQFKKKKRKKEDVCLLNIPQAQGWNWDALVDRHWPSLQEFLIFEVWQVSSQWCYNVVILGGKKEGQMDGQTERRKSEGFSSGPDRLRKAFQGKHKN